MNCPGILDKRAGPLRCLLHRLSPLALLALSGCGSFVIGAQPAIRQGGRAVSIAVEPGADPYLLVASETGGLFRSQDGGLKWSHVDSLPSWLVRDMAYSPSNGNIVIATTQDDYVSAGNGGIWRSTDGGRTWSRPPGAIPPAGPTCTERHSAHGISFDRNTGRVVVGTDCGIAIGANNGAAWFHVIINPPAAGAGFWHRVWSVLALPGNRIYAAGDRAIGVSADGGGTWRLVAGEPSRAQGGAFHAIAASPFNVDHVFLVARKNDGTIVLFLSSDAGRTWTEEKTGDPNAARAALVRVARAVDGTSNAFDVYFGGGLHLWRRRYTNDNPPTPTGNWQRVTVDHVDPSDIAFSRDGRTPILVATDGGVHRTGDGGASWTLIGGGRDGYNALQITDATGQLVGGSSPHIDLYFGTQDNSIWASPDGGATWPANIGGEGFHLRTPRRADADGASVVTGSRCAPCSSFLADSHLANPRQWPNAPDGDANPNDDQGVPFLIHPRTYIQRVENNDVDPPVQSLMLTTDTGTTWTARGAVPVELVGPPVVGGGGTPTPVVYNAIRRDGVNPDGSQRLGLVRVDNLFGPGDIRISDADGGLGSIGTFPTMFARYRLLGVNSMNPDHLIAPDIATGEMKSSFDGGRHWSVEAELTSLVTDAGTYRFSITGFSLVSAIAWDPDNGCHVLIGTRQNGIFRSTDGGRTWTKFADSQQITNVSSFFFETPATVLVSTYGRGLWRMLVTTVPTTCARHLVSAPGPAAVLEVWEMTHARQPFKEPGNPPICPRCTYVLVHWGEVTDVELLGTSLRSLGVSGGLVRHVPQTGGVAPLPRIEVKALPGLDKGPSVLSQIRRQKLAVRGLVLEGEQLRGFIAGRGELTNADLRPPRLRIFPRDVASGDPMLFPGQTLTVYGEGFRPQEDSGAPLSLSVDGGVRAKSLGVDRRGAFRYEFSVNELPGDHVIEVVQVDKVSARVVRQSFNVVPLEMTHSK